MACIRVVTPWWKCYDNEEEKSYPIWFSTPLAIDNLEMMHRKLPGLEEERIRVVSKVGSETLDTVFTSSICEWGMGVTLRAKLFVLYDCATDLYAHHMKNVIHGNLTPESVGVEHGRGTLRDLSLTRLPDPKVSWTREPLHDDVGGARWAATEFFRLDNDDLSPTKMSDVYSFSCVMLQILTGKVPYCGTKRPEQVVYLKHLGREPIDARTPKIADRYVKFMRWCWSPEPEKRPTMETVVDFIHEEIKRVEQPRN